MAEHYYGAPGMIAYTVFDAINASFFGKELPWPLIIWGLTPHGRCLGLTTAVVSGPPLITLHPSLLRAGEKADPWNVDRSWLGVRFTCDVLLHECIHLAVAYRLKKLDEIRGRIPTWSSHNNPYWISEVNRVAALMGFADVQAAMSKPKRVPIPGRKTKRGKQATRVQRVSEGNVPFESAAWFPHGLREHLGVAQEYYQSGDPPDFLKGSVLTQVRNWMHLVSHDPDKVFFAEQVLRAASGR